MKQLFYLPIWFLQTRILGVIKPLQSVIFITDKCNLHCKHCCVHSAFNNIHKEPIINSYQEVKEKLEYCYQLGSRFVDFEGGEPLLWKDESDPNDIKDINALFRLARKIGFYSVTLTTNGQYNFDNCEANSVWISMDGLGDYHDAIRGKGTFETILQNINSNPHPDLSINMVVNNLNYKSVTETIQFVQDHPKIKSISINFHTPFPGTDELILPIDIRKNIIDSVIEMKKNGYPIMNSITGLSLMKHNNFTKYCWVSNFVYADGTKHNQCQGHSLELCDKCGFCMAGEMFGVMNLKIDTILSAVKLRLKTLFN